MAVDDRPLGSDPERLGGVVPHHPARPLQHEVPVQQPLQEVGPLGHLVGREAEGGVGPQAGGGAGHLLPHGQEVAGGGEHVVEDGVEGGDECSTGLGRDPSAQLGLEERLPLLGVAGGQDRRQPAVGVALTAEHGVEDAGDLVAQPVELLLHRGHDELTVLAADLDHRAGGVPPVHRHPRVDQPHLDRAGRPTVDEVEGVDESDRGRQRVGVLQLLARHPPEHGPGERLHQFPSGPGGLTRARMGSIGRGAGPSRPPPNGMPAVGRREASRVGRRPLGRPARTIRHEELPACCTSSRTLASRSNEASTSPWSSAR